MLTGTFILRRVVLACWFGTLAVFDATAASNSITATLLRTFGFLDRAGETPQAPLLKAPDGAIYGTTTAGGKWNAGVAFRISPAPQSEYQVIHHFGELTPVNSQPAGPLLLGPKGHLIGCTTSGGKHSGGSMFSLGIDGRSFRVLRDFGAFPSDGLEPTGALLIASDGFIYGVTRSGGSLGLGTLYRIKEDGTGYSQLSRFGGADLQTLARPSTGLLQGPNGLFYGAATEGGSGERGGVFTFDPATSMTLTLFSFQGPDSPRVPVALVGGSDGWIYGATGFGGANGSGAVWRMRYDGLGFSTILHLPKKTSKAWLPGISGLVQGSNGLLVGSVDDGGSGYLFQINQKDLVFRELHRFSLTDGSTPMVGLSTGPEGWVYGTTLEAGNGFEGTLFRVHPGEANFSTVHHFHRFGGDVSGRDAQVVEYENGLYGVSTSGGAFSGGGIFRMALDGSGYAILHSFSRSWGPGPYSAKLIKGLNGDLYSIVDARLTADAASAAQIFRIKPDRSGFALIYELRNVSDVSSLLYASDHRLYSILSIRADDSVPPGPVESSSFLVRLDPNGGKVEYLARLGGLRPRGDAQASDISEGTDGRLYCAIRTANSSSGSYVFSINKDGSGFRTLAELPMEGGANPSAVMQLTESFDGSLYGAGERTLYRVWGNGSGFVPIRDDFAVIGRVVEGREGFLYGIRRVFDGIEYFRVSREGRDLESLAQTPPGFGDSTPCSNPVLTSNSVTGFLAKPDLSGAGELYRISIPLGKLPPENVLSSPAIVSGRFTATVRLRPGLNFVLESTDSLLTPNWRFVAAGEGVGSVTDLVDSRTPASQRFYRLQMFGPPIKGGMISP